MKKRLLLCLVCLLTLAAALGGCRGGKSGSSSSITIGIGQDIEESLDPHKMTAAGTKEIFFNVYEGLYKPDCDGNIEPAVASGYEVSEDFLEYTFELRDGVKFHDGSLVTAEDVEYSIRKFAGIDGGTPTMAAFSVITDVAVVDDSHVKVTLSAPSQDLIPSLATVEAAIIPKSNEDPDHVAIGTGPYKYVSHSPMENVIMELNEDYYGEKGYIDEVVFKICTNPDTIAMELNGGSIDMICHLTEAQVNSISEEDYNVLKGSMNLVQAMYLNHNFEPFADGRVRQAMCYAIDEEEVRKFVADPPGEAIGSSIYPNFSKYFDESLVGLYPKDTEKAKELLEEAGYPNGFSFTITVPANYQQHVDTALAISQQLAEVGITAEVKTVDWDTWLSETYLGRNYEATVIGVDAPTLTASALLSRFVSDADNNFTNYNNPIFDSAYEKASTCMTDEEVELYKACERILAQDAANVYIQDLPEFVAISKDYEGYEFYPMYIIDVSKIKPVEAE